MIIHGRKKVIATKVDDHENEKFCDRQLYNYPEASNFLCISVSHLRLLKNQGKISFVPIGTRGIRFSKESLDNWILKSEKCKWEHVS